MSDRKIYYADAFVTVKFVTGGLHTNSIVTINIRCIIALIKPKLFNSGLCQHVRNAKIVKKYTYIAYYPRWSLRYEIQGIQKMNITMKSMCILN